MKGVQSATSATLTAGVKAGTDTSPAVFVIPRKVNIASDSKPHKVRYGKL